MKLETLAIVLVFTFAMMLPQLEGAVGGEPEECDDSCIAVLMNEAYEAGLEDGKQKALRLPDGPRIPWNKKGTKL